MNPLLAAKMSELLHSTNIAQDSPQPARTPPDLALTTVQSQMPLEEAEQAHGPSKQHRSYEAQHQHHDSDLKTHVDFLTMNQKIGTRDAVKMFVIRGFAERTLYS
jgi:hypothetical protein